MGKIGCVAIVRNEERHIAEWLAWQFALGFDTVFLLDNASTDATAAIARAMAPRLDIRVFDYPYRGADYQIRAYEMAARTLANNYDWLAYFDTDEFLRLDDGLTLKALLAARPEAAIAVPWAIFGSSGHEEMPGDLVIEAFQRRSPAEFPPNQHIKSIIRPSLMEACLNPHAFKMRGAYADLAGRPVPWGHHSGYMAAPPDYACGALNHYFTRAAAQWRAKLARGYPDTSRAMEDFTLYDRNELADARLAAQAGLVRSLMTKPPPKYRFVLVACARWEKDCIAEWIAYHRHIGFEHIYLYCNDDAPDALYAAVLPFLQGPAPFVTFQHFAPLGQQKAMYLHYLRRYKDDAEWMMFLDIDEFLRLPRHETVAAFIAEHGPAADAIYFNWCFFGHNGYDERPAGSVLLNYTHRAASSHNPMTKMMTRTSAIALERLQLGPATDFWHYWDALEDFAALRAVNVLGRDMHDYIGDLDAARAYLDEPGVYEAMIAAGIVNHYAHKSRQDFLRRAARGTEGPFENQISFKQQYESGQMDVVLRRLNAVEDNVLRDLWAGVLARGREGAITGFTGLPNRANGPLTWSIAAAPAGRGGTVYFVLEAEPAKIAAALAAGHKTVVVEPDAKAYYALAEQFAEDRAAGRMALENYMPAEQDGGIILFTPPGGGPSFHVGTIGWRELVAKHGAPAALYLPRAVPGFPAPVQLH